MIIPHDQLRSIISEAGRQADFYLRRQDQPLAQLWAEIESLASLARSTRRSLLIGVSDSFFPIPIKPCE